MKKTKTLILICLYILLLRNILAENFIDIIRDESVTENLINYKQNILEFSYNGKTLLLDVDSLTNYDFSDENKIKEVLLILEDVPKIIFKNEKELLTIKQIEDGETYIYFGCPKDIEKTDQSLIYIVEHYIPDKKINDLTKKNGEKRLSLVIKNNPKIEINFSGILLRKNKINKNSLETHENNEYNENIKNKEIYIINNNLIENNNIDNNNNHINNNNKLNNNKLTKIFFFEKLFLKKTFSFKYDKDYDLGFFIEDETKEELKKELKNYIELAENFVDVTQENCKKFSSNLNNEWLIYTYTKDTDIIEFLNNITKDNINENNINENKEKKIIIKLLNIEISEVNNIIETIKQELNKNYNNEDHNKNSYFMIFDKPNTEFFNTNDVDITHIIQPEDYLTLILNAKNLGINLIMPPLELGKNETTQEKIRLNALNYYDTLFLNHELLNSIDYFAIVINTTNKQGLRYCVNASRIPFYKNEIYCLDTLYAYRRILERAKEYSQKEIKVIIFIDTNIENSIDEETIENLKIDPYVENVFINKKVCKE